MTRLQDQMKWNGWLTHEWGERTETAIRTWGVDAFFENIDGLFLTDEHGAYTMDGDNNSALTGEEREALAAVTQTINAAVASGAADLSADDFLGGEWAGKIKSRMNEAVAIMRKRGGFFSTVREEPEPSITAEIDFPQPVYMPLAADSGSGWTRVDAGRPALGQGELMILGPMPPGAQWAFQPGTIVETKWTRLPDDREGIAAIAAVSKRP